MDPLLIAVIAVALWVVFHLAVALIRVGCALVDNSEAYDDAQRAGVLTEDRVRLLGDRYSKERSAAWRAFWRGLTLRR